jgi:cytochrome c oxidase assembly factor CtaG
MAAMFARSHAARATGSKYGPDAMALAHVTDQGGGLPPLSWWSTVTESAVAPLPALLVVVAGTAYLIGVRRLARRGRHWSPARSAAFACGIAALAVATQSGLAAYDAVLFSAHVAQHVLIGVVAPFFLALGAPVTLALQASSRPVQVGLLRVLRSAPVRAVTHPIVATALFGLTLFALYFSPMYELSLRNSVAHELVHLHFFVAGSVFFWAVIGLDPIAWRIPYGYRLALVLLTVPFHAFLGLALMSGDQPVAADHYAHVDRPTEVSVMGDQRTGAGVMWGIGDVIGVVAGGVVVLQWMRHEDRATRRRDAIADRNARVDADLGGPLR